MRSGLSHDRQFGTQDKNGGIAMTRHIAPSFAIALLSVSVVACDKPGVTEQQKETKATEQAANAANEAERQAQSAQAAAERDIAKARADFDKAREDYLHGRRLDLDDLDKRIADLEAKVKTATGKTKAEYDARLPAVRAQRDAFARHMQGLASSTAATWDQAKANLDKEWDTLKTAVENAR
jgi:flagellar motility protein MotE (MotC chaperone)